MTHEYSPKARGFVLVFSRDTPQFYCEIKDGKLQVTTKEDFTGDTMVCGCRVRRKIRKGIRDPSNILRALEDVGLEYILTESPDPMRRYLIAVVTAPMQICEDWAEIKGLQLPIEAKEAIKQGRRNPGFMLAHRTFVPILDSDDTFRDFIESNEQEENDDFVDASAGFISGNGQDGYYQLSNDGENNNTNQFGSSSKQTTSDKVCLNIGGSEVEYRMLPLSLWEGVYIQFDLSRVPRVVYKLNHDDNDNDDSDNGRKSVLNNTGFLRVLFDIITESRRQGGANYNLPRYCRLKNHPLLNYFALNCGQKPFLMNNNNNNNQSSLLSKVLLVSCNTDEGSLIANLWHDSIAKIRDYYGEHIAYYMAFLSHYTVWLFYLLPLSIIWQCYTTWFINTKKPSNPNLIPNGSHWFLLIYLIWGSLMLEYWYRRESALSVKWGSIDQMSLLQSKSRPTFRGQTRLSPVNGDIIQTYTNGWSKYMRMFVSMSGIYTFMAAVIVSVVLIWKLKSRDDLQSNQEFTVAIGISNAIQIQIFNWMYVYFANFVNEWENHRLESEYYNNLVIKRIFFLLVNSFNSVFYLTFYKNFGSGHRSRLKRLKAVRIQLNTLFWTEIIIQNLTEVILPKMMRWWEDRKWKQHAREVGLTASDEPAIIVHSRFGTISEEMLTRAAYVKPSFHGASASASAAAVAVADAAEVGGVSESHNQDQHQHQKEQVDVTDQCELLRIWPEVIADIEAQLQSYDTPEVLDDTAEIVLHYGYVILFAVIFPIMPLLSLMNNFIEFAVDFHNYTHFQRPVPHSSKGIGVWKPVIASFTILGVFTNFAFLFFKSDVFDHLNLGHQRKHFIYWVVCLAISLALSLLKYAIADQSKHTRQSILRQRLIEKELLLIGKKAGQSGEQSKKAKQAVRKWRAQLQRQQSKKNRIDETRQRYSKMNAGSGALIIPSAPPADGSDRKPSSSKDSINGLI